MGKTPNVVTNPSSKRRSGASKERVAQRKKGGRQNGMPVWSASSEQGEIFGSPALGKQPCMAETTRREEIRSIKRKRDGKTEKKEKPKRVTCADGVVARKATGGQQR